MFTGSRTDTVADSVRSAAFQMSIPGMDDTATFRKVSGLSSKHEVVTEVKSGAMGKVTVLKQPGRFVLGEVTLERGFTTSMDLWDWRETIINGQIQDNRKDVTITLFNHGGDPVVAYILKNAWPCELGGPDLDAASNEIAVEKLVLACERVERSKP